mmetsp:Transcript_50088/g.150768  ORF Transcript_50088/g.150768 Transcript_50088/m.150768 type:complete len:236 (+) Transcript_50088:1854-2561(+)
MVAASASSAGRAPPSRLPPGTIPDWSLPTRPTPRRASSPSQTEAASCGDSPRASLYTYAREVGGTDAAVRRRRTHPRPLRSQRPHTKAKPPALQTDGAGAASPHRSFEPSPKAPSSPRGSIWTARRGGGPRPTGSWDDRGGLRRDGATTRQRKPPPSPRSPRRRRGCGWVERRTPAPPSPTATVGMPCRRCSSWSGSGRSAPPPSCRRQSAAGSSRPRGAGAPSTLGRWEGAAGA